MTGGLLAVCAAGSAGAQDAQGFFERLGVEQGLAQQTVTALVQDRQGFLWIGTQAGLSRYDGYEFQTFAPTPDDPSTLSDAYINALLADVDGGLWIGTDAGGLNHLDPLSAGFTAWRHDPDRSASLSANRVLSLLRDRRGTLWVGTEAGLDRFDPGTGAFVHMAGARGDAVYALHEDRAGDLWAGTTRGVFRVEAAAERLMPAAATLAPVRAVAEAAAEQLWLGTEAGLLRFDPADGSLRAQAYPLERLAGGAHVRALLRDGAGTLWVGTRAGLARRRATGNWLGFRRAANDPWSLPENVIFALLEDRQGVIWTGTYGGGLTRYVPWKNAFRRYLHDPKVPDSLAQDIVFPIHQDREGLLWVGTYNRGLDRLDPVTGRAVHYRHDAGDPASLSGDEVRAVLEDSRGRLWVGTNHNGLNLLDRRLLDRDGAFTHFRHDPDDPASLGHDSVVALLEAAEGGLWVGTWGGGLDYLDPATGAFTHFRHDPEDAASLSHDRIMALHRDRHDYLWIGTDGGGLNRLDPRTGRIERHLHRPGDPNSLSHNTIEAIHGDAQGRLWLATRYGLNRFDPDTGRFRRYFKRDGLADNLVLGVLGDAAGRLWISTNLGLSRLDPSTGTFRNFYADDGPGVEEFNSFAHHAGEDGTLYFGGIHGLIAFQPEAVSTPQRPMPVVLTGLRLFNEPVVPRPAAEDALLRRSITHTESLTLTHHQSVITFEFAALDLADPDGVRYAYRLDGLDDGWIETDASRRLATYTYLPAGKFRFRARARDADGRFSPEAALMLTVQPPPWRSAWAYALYAAAALLLLTGVFRYYRQRLIAAHLARERDAAERATRMKSAFLAVMTHEIRTPLNGVLGMLELLRNMRLAGKQRAYVENIYQAGQALLAILNDVLDYSRVEAERTRFELTDFDLRPLIDSLAMLVSARATDKNLTLETEISDEVPGILQGDPGRLRQVLLNLLGNAVKFTGRGGVSLRVLPLAADKDEVRLRFEVRDTGPGIDPARQRQLFQDYSQLDPSITRRYGGSGLGLAICKRLVEAQGGSIGVRSRLGEGATFWFELGFGTGVAHATRLETATNVAVSPLRVLVVDDVEINRDVATGLLGLDGHRPEAAENGRQALALLQSDDFDLVLMDLRMHDIDGLEATRRIRALADPLKSGIPVVGMTASVDPDEICRCLKAGMNQVLRKPVTLDALRTALAGVHATPEAGAQSASSDDAPLLDSGMLRQHWQALGAVRLRGIVERFRQNGAELLASLREAGERDDVAIVQRASHQLAGAAGGLGCLRLSQWASAMESDTRQGDLKPESLVALDTCFRKSLAAMEDALADFPLERRSGRRERL